MIVMGLILLVTWAYFLIQGEIRFMNARISRETSPQKYWIVQGCILLLAMFCIWIQLPGLIEAFQAGS